MKKIGEEEWEIDLPAQAEDFFHTEGEIQLSRGKGVITHEVIGFHVKVAAKFTDFPGVGDMNPGIRIGKVTGVHKKNILLFPAELFDKGRTPGQTAKQEIFSAAGLHFALDIGREYNGEGFPRRSIGRLGPSRKGKQKKKKKCCQNLVQKSHLEITEPFIPTHQKRISRVSSTERTPTISISPKSPVTRR